MMDLQTFLKSYISSPPIISSTDTDNHTLPLSSPGSQYSLFQLQSVSNDATSQIKRLTETLAKGEESLLSCMNQIKDVFSTSTGSVGGHENNGSGGMLEYLVQKTVESTLEKHLMLSFDNIKQGLTKDYQSLSAQLSKLECCIDVKFQKGLLHLLSELVKSVIRTTTNMQHELASMSQLIPFMNQLNLVKNQMDQMNNLMVNMSKIVTDISRQPVGGDISANQDSLKREVKVGFNELEREIRMVRGDVVSMNATLRQDIASVAGVSSSFTSSTELEARLRKMEDKLELLVAKMSSQQQLPSCRSTPLNNVANIQPKLSKVISIHDFLPPPKFAPPRRINDIIRGEGANIGHTGVSTSAKKLVPDLAPRPASSTLTSLPPSSSPDTPDFDLFFEIPPPSAVTVLDHGGTTIKMLPNRNPSPATKQPRGNRFMRQEKIMTRSARKAFKGARKEGCTKPATPKNKLA